MKERMNEWNQGLEEHRLETTDLETIFWANVDDTIQTDYI
jgi:hypothetical protein